MLRFLEKLFSTDFMPHGQCLLWQPGVLWLNVVSDSVIALSYFAIPFILAYFVFKRRDLGFNRIFLMFSAFIFLCGTTHLLDVLVLWVPIYRFQGVVKLLTAGVSAAAAGMLVPVVPRMLVLPNPARLETVNRELADEVEDRKRAEEEVRRLNAELEARVRGRTADLERSNQDLQQFAYVASHDLQEPLRMVSGYVELLERRYRGKLDADADEFIGYAVDGAERMRRLISDLLKFSRVGEEVRFQEFPLEDALDDALMNLKRAVEDAGASVSYHELPRVHGDRNLVTQVFQNLIGNAIKFRGEKPMRIEVSVRREEAAWLVSVEDNGIGIDPAHAERIFRIFQRLHGRDDYPGTGVGLAICRRIVERHGGRIWFDSEPGAGTAFRFTLPDGGAC